MVAEPIDVQGDVEDGCYGVRVGTHEEVWIVGSLKTAQHVKDRNHRSDVEIVISQDGKWVTASA